MSLVARPRDVETKRVDEAKVLSFVYNAIEKWPETRDWFQDKQTD